MELLIKISNTISFQVLCDALNEQKIEFRVDNAGMHSLLPLPVVMDMQVMVNQSDMRKARQVLQDLEMDA